MQFRLDRFYRINRRALIWAAILWLIYVLRDFFALIFLTFLIVSFTLPVINYFQKNTRLPRKAIIVGLYTVILGGLVGLFYYVIPKVLNETYAVSGELYKMESSIMRVRDDLGKRTPAVKPLLEKFISDDEIENFRSNALTQLRPVLAESARIAFTAITTILLSLLFSFLIVLDLTRLTVEVRRLERSKLHDFYEESAQPVVRFAAVIARAFQAQAVIACANTALTFIGFMALGLPKVALLTLLVFFFSFIPVLGVFISTAPAVLIAINSFGYGKAFAVVILVTIVHLIEAYILNPFIYGKHLKLNPVLVLLILFIGHHFFGIWGMVLGVPVTYYFLVYVFGVQLEEIEDAEVKLKQEPQEMIGDSVPEMSDKSPEKSEQSTSNTDRIATLRRIARKSDEARDPSGA